MNIEAMKLDIMEKLLLLNKEEALEKINKILDKETIVAYSVTGKPLTKKAYNEKLLKAEQQIAAGNFKTQEDLEKETENW